MILIKSAFPRNRKIRGNAIFCCTQQRKVVLSWCLHSQLFTQPLKGGGGVRSVPPGGSRLQIPNTFLTWGERDIERDRMSWFQHKWREWQRATFEEGQGEECNLNLWKIIPGWRRNVLKCFPMLLRVFSSSQGNIYPLKLSAPEATKVVFLQHLLEKKRIWHVVWDLQEPILSFHYQNFWASSLHDFSAVQIFLLFVHSQLSLPLFSDEWVKDRKK